MTEPVVLTRRRLVQAGGAATAALYLAPFASSAPAASVPPCLTRSAYAGLLGDGFATDGGVALRLVEVADLVRARHEADFRGRDDAFTLLLEGPVSPVLASGSHALTHPALGSFSLFLSPVDAIAGTQRYEVVVDRSVRFAEAAQVAPEPMAQTNAVAAAPAAGGASSGPAPAGKKSATPSLLVGVHVARRGGVLSADVRVRAHQGVISVRGTLLRDGREVARAARLMRGKAGVRLALRELRPVRPGRYTLRVTITDRRGRRHVTTVPVTLR